MKNKMIFLGISLLILSCSNPEARKPIVRKTSSFISESVDRNKSLNSFEENLFKGMMDHDSLNEYVNSEFGFWYTFHIKDSVNDVYPEKGDQVIYNYEVRDFQNEIIYSTIEIGDQSYFIDEEEIITGLQQGLKLMKEGEMVTFLFPSHLAYGYSGNERVQSNQPLIYKVHLKKIINKN